MSATGPDLVEHAERLTAIFGRWPSFHDAEVDRIVFDRSGPDGPTLEARIHVFRMTSAVDPAGYYVLANHTWVTFRFFDVLLNQFADFNHQNVLDDVEITPASPDASDGRAIDVWFSSIYGVGAAFTCKRCEIVTAQPFVPAGR